MKSHSVTCHPAELTFSPLFSDFGGMQGWVDPFGWLHTEMVHSPAVLTGPEVLYYTIRYEM